MNADTFTYILEHPENINATQTAEIRNLIDQFPYFQSAHALYLKGLKNQGSFTYNKALKITAVHTTDRSVLFDYITSEAFNQNDVSLQIQQQDANLQKIKVTAYEDVSQLVEVEELDKASKILNPDLFVAKEDSAITPDSPEKMLQLGKPLEFRTSEAHSFSEWLKLAAFKPIDRSNEKVIEKSTIKEKEITRSLAPPQKLKAARGLRNRQEKIIDAFIENNPKIRVSNSKKSDPSAFQFNEQSSSESLMTETLARVYLEQKNYKKAAQAYRILSLKYPEKSGFFADQIRAIQQLEENKEL